MTTRLVTWNVQGRARPDLDAVADVIRGLEPDLVLLQEVQRAQARRLARRLGWFRIWRFKHWSIVVPAEGLAILSPTPLLDVRRIVLAMPWSFWSWRRRIALATSTPDGVRVVDTHLGAGVSDAERTRQAMLTIELAGGGPAAVCGDLNTHPGSPVLRAYEDAGFVDAWSVVGDGPGHTNWQPGPRTQPPAQRLDYVLVGGGVLPMEASVPDDDEAVEEIGALSDHVPVMVSFDVPG